MYNKIAIYKLSLLIFFEDNKHNNLGYNNVIFGTLYEIKYDDKIIILNQIKNLVKKKIEENFFNLK
jgi:hypothetical protein